MITGLLGSLGAEAIVIIAIVVLLYIVYKIGKSLFKVIVGIIINSVLGVAVIWLADTVFAMGIPFAVYTILPAAIFDLPAAGTMIILRFFGIPL